MKPSRACFLTVCLSLLLAPGAFASPSQKVPAAARRALRSYLEAPRRDDSKELARLLRVVKKSLKVAVATIRSHSPLSKAKPGTRHEAKFTSGGHEWEYSIRLPRGYDNKKPFPVLVLPDHGGVGAEAGIAFWEKSKLVEKCILFRPIIVKHQQNKERFPNQQFFARDQAIAEVMRDALTHLRLHYAVDHNRFFMTGLSQAGFYTWYYSVSFPDQFAGIVPESAGGLALRAGVLPLARNLSSLRVRILHTQGDKVTPYTDARLMEGAVKEGGGSVELITYEDEDYPGGPFPNRHPGPHHLRLRNVLPWGIEQKRKPTRSFTRVLRYRQQGREGAFRITPPDNPTDMKTVSCSEKNGVLAADSSGVVYLVSPEEIGKRKAFRVGSRTVRPKPDLKKLFESFKALGDPDRLVAAEIRVRE